MRGLLPGGRTDKTSRFYEATAIDVDVVRKKIRCRDDSPVTSKEPEFDIPYDKLVVSVGAPFNTMGTPGVEENAFFLKEVEDALSIRGRLIDMLETASLPGNTEEDRRAMCSVVVVGGGPVGVAFAAEIRDFLDQDATRYYPDLRGLASVTIVHSDDHILNLYDQRISDYAARQSAFVIGIEARTHVDPTNKKAF